MIEMKKYNGKEKSLPKCEILVLTDGGHFFHIYPNPSVYGGWSTKSQRDEESVEFTLHGHYIVAYCEKPKANIKDTMRTHNGFTFEWEEAEGVEGYVSSVEHESLCWYFCSESIGFGSRLKEKRILSKTKEQAISLSKAMLGIDPN